MAYHCREMQMEEGGGCGEIYRNQEVRTEMRRGRRGESWVDAEARGRLQACFERGVMSSICRHR